MLKSQIDVEIDHIKEKLMEMWDLVGSQLDNGRDAMEQANSELAREIIKAGKKVNKYDVKIDRQCERFFALYTPVAVDLRTILAILKINANLERIGDTAEGIAYLVKKLKSPLKPELTESTSLQPMFEEAMSMFKDCQRAFTETDTTLAREIIKRDNFLNKIHRKAEKVVLKYLSKEPDVAKIEEGIILLGLIKRIEQVGDQISDIAGEIVFYKEAKIVRHKGKNKKKKKKDEPSKD